MWKIASKEMRGVFWTGWIQKPVRNLYRYQKLTNLSTNYETLGSILWGVLYGWKWDHPMTGPSVEYFFLIKGIQNTYKDLLT